MQIPPLIISIVLILVGIVNIILGSIIYLSLKNDGSTKDTNAKNSATGVFWVGIILLLMGAVHGYGTYKGVNIMMTPKSL